MQYQKFLNDNINNIDSVWQSGEHTLIIYNKNRCILVKDNKIIKHPKDSWIIDTKYFWKWYKPAGELNKVLYE